MQYLLLGCGVFTICLGVVHFLFPVLLDFENAIPKQGAELKPFRLAFYRYDTKRSDVHGIAWLMNHAVSFVLVSIGVFDLFAFRWLGTATGAALSAWVAILSRPFKKEGIRRYRTRRSSLPAATKVSAKPSGVVTFDATLPPSSLPAPFQGERATEPSRP